MIWLFVSPVSRSLFTKKPKHHERARARAGGALARSLVHSKQQQALSPTVLRSSAVMPTRSCVDLKDQLGLRVTKREKNPAACATAPPRCGLLEGRIISR